MMTETMLRNYHQEHLLEYYRQLDKYGKENLERQVHAFDWSLLKLLEEQPTPTIQNQSRFAPIKNRTGVDSVETAQALLEKNGICL